MNKYQKTKEGTINKAIERQYDFANCNYSWEELYEFGCRFKRLAKRYGLAREFKENVII